jgi:hypothetical protein
MRPGNGGEGGSGDNGGGGGGVAQHQTEGGARPSGQPMNQISIKTPNPKCRLFLKIDQ